MEETLNEAQELYEFCVANSEILSEEYDINFEEFKHFIDNIANGISELDQLHAKYKNKLK